MYIVLVRCKKRIYFEVMESLLVIQALLFVRISRGNAYIFITFVLIRMIEPLRTVLENHDKPIRYFPFFILVESKILLRQFPTLILDVITNKKFFNQFDLYCFRVLLCVHYFRHLNKTSIIYW